MKKNHFILVVFFSAIYTNVFGQEHLEKENFNIEAFSTNMNGSPKWVKTTTLFSGGINKDSINETESYITEDSYNSSKIKTSQTMFSIDGNLIGSTDFKYAPDGTIPQIDYLDMYGNLITRIKYTYNESKNWTSATVYRGGFDLKSVIKYIYNPNQKIAEIIQYDDFELPTEIESFIYNQEGLDSLKIFYNGKRKLKSKAVFSYEKGRVSDYKTYNEDGLLTETYQADYNSEGIISTAVIHTFSANPLEKTVFSYDKYGNPVVRLVSYPEGIKPESITKISYLYDEQGNWLKKEIYTDGIFSVSANRQIDYYTDKK